MIMPAFALAVPMSGQMTRIVRTAVGWIRTTSVLLACWYSKSESSSQAARSAAALITLRGHAWPQDWYLVDGAVVTSKFITMPWHGYRYSRGIQGNEQCSGRCCCRCTIMLSSTLLLICLYILINLTWDWCDGTNEKKTSREIEEAAAEGVLLWCKKMSSFRCSCHSCLCCSCFCLYQTLLLHITLEIFNARQAQAMDSFWY